MIGTYRRGLIAASLASLCVFAVVHAQDAFSPAERLRRQGHEAMRKKNTERAIGFYEKSLKLNPALTQNHLSLAAAYLEKSDDVAACDHLAKYVHNHPKHVVMRSRYAELLLRVGHHEAARRQFFMFIEHTQDREQQFLNEQIYSYRRLMEIAETQKDIYNQYLNRGVALYLLAKKRNRLDIADGQYSSESLLIKAAGELSAARLTDRGQARPCWYLHLIWKQLGQQQVSRRFLRLAEQLAPFGELTISEQRDLVLAGRRVIPLPKGAEKQHTFPPSRKIKENSPIRSANRHPMDVFP